MTLWTRDDAVAATGGARPPDRTGDWTASGVSIADMTASMSAHWP